MADVAKTFHACFNAFPMRGDDGRGTFRAPKTGPVQSPQFLQCLTPYQQVRLRERLHFMQRARVNARAPPISAISEKHYGR